MNTRTYAAAGALLLAALGCRDDTTAPIEPAPASSPAIAAAATTLSFWQISTGQYHTCGVTTDYRAYCWGYDASGQLGDGFVVGTIGIPFPVQGGLFFKQVDAGGFHTCGVTTGNRAYCWGEGFAVGNGTTTKTWWPRAVSGGRSFRQVSTGMMHSCGVTTDNRAWCWGYNTSGQLGDGTTATRLTPVAVLGGLAFKQVSAGDQHTCGVTTDNRAWCWGSNRYGQIGDSSTAARRLRPVRVRGRQAFTQIDAGIDHTCAVTTATKAFCWGRNTVGQLGDGTTVLRRWPRAVAGTLLFRRVTAGAGHTCGETPSSRAWCWGTNGHGGLGDGTTTARLMPVAVAGGLLFRQLNAGLRTRTCGKTDTGAGYCWGDNMFYALGDGSDQEFDALTPTPVAATTY